ncbi:hypothetical protein [Hymenobacter glacieicola]|uniref:Uncharacterized protein n=1 Tax=Hymenobacter glacieicola TaxID=1562124 RepID=A0ABQ1WMG1_9BACT|nr:hypothetical protein [Hymenobacter glacieicola]GGG34289.1 hypothetical protein GCM10011378_08380 [Hymenobacter glacieicola]
MLVLNIRPRPISILELFTSTRQTFNAPGCPRYLDIPVAAGSTGTSILFYGRSNGQTMENKYVEVVQAPSIQPGGFGMYAQSVVGFEAFADGVGGFTSPKDKFAGDRWTRIVLRTPASYPNRTAGIIRLSSTEPQYGPANFDFADIRIYSRALTPAEVANPFPPSDQDAWYTFAGVTGTEVPDETGNGHTATLVY